MKRIIFLFAVLSACSAPAWATWSLTQVNGSSSCGASSTTCTVTLSSTGAGHLLVAAVITSKSTTDPITAVTSALCASTWVHCPSCSAASSGPGSVDAYYCLNSAAGQTSGTFTITSSTGSSWIAVIFEAAATGAIALDSGATPDATKVDSTNCTSCAAPSLTLSGNNDFIVSVAGCGSTCTGVSGAGWTNDLSNPDGDAIAHGLNVTSMGLTWTQSSSSTLVTTAIAFQESSVASANTSPARVY